MTTRPAVGTRVMVTNGYQALHLAGRELYAGHTAVVLGTISAKAVHVKFDDPAIQQYHIKDSMSKFGWGWFKDGLLPCSDER